MNSETGKKILWNNFSNEYNKNNPDNSFLSPNDRTLWQAVQKNSQRFVVEVTVVNGPYRTAQAVLEEIWKQIDAIDGNLSNSTHSTILLIYCESNEVNFRVVQDYFRTIDCSRLKKIVEIYFTFGYQLVNKGYPYIQLL